MQIVTPGMLEPQLRPCDDFLDPSVHTAETGTAYKFFPRIRPENGLPSCTARFHSGNQVYEIGEALWVNLENI